MVLKNYIYKENHITLNQLYDFLYANKDDGRIPLDQRVDIAEFAAKMKRNGDFFEIWQDDKIVALIVAYINNYETKEAFITYVRTTQIARGNGLASFLLEKVFEKCSERGFCSVSLEVDRINSPAITLYRRTGFILSREIADALFMKKSLS